MTSDIISTAVLADTLSDVDTEATYTVRCRSAEQAADISLPLYERTAAAEMVDFLAYLDTMERRGNARN